MAFPALILIKLKSSLKFLQTASVPNFIRIWRMGQIQSHMLLNFVVPIYPKLTVSERHYLEIFVNERLPKGTKSVHNTGKRP